MGHGARSLHLLDFQCDSIRFVHAHPDWQNRLALHVLEHHDGHVRDGIHHQAADLHFHFHRGLPELDRGLMMDPVTNMPIVVLKDVQGQAILPIWVGVYEANAIALEIEKVQTPRPMTHDLLKNFLLGLEVRVQKIVVNDLKDDTFYAMIWVERDGHMMTIHSPPRDSLPLALRMDCPIFVDEAVLKNSKISSAFSERNTNEQLRTWLDGLSDEDLGRYKM